MKFHQLAVIFLSIFLIACSNPNQSTTQKEAPPSFQNKGHELIYKMVQKAGDYQAFLEKKDVVYTYTYQTPDGKADISTEKYIFDGELSYGAYQQHERTFPDLEGPFEQGYDGKEYWLKHNGEALMDEERLKRVAFNRPTNFYWFAMLPKLLDPDLNYEFLGEKVINDKTYDIVKVSFKSADNKPTDIYQMYINQQTSIADLFLFTVADFGVMETPFLMTIDYENIDGLMIPTKRQYKRSTWDAEISEDPWINVTWSDIKFNNNLTAADFKK